MKRLLLLFFLIPTFSFAQPRSKEVEERVKYLKSNPVFVTQLTLDEKKMKKLDDKHIKDIKLETETFNKNIRTAFTTFWDISDTIIFVNDKELQDKMKEFKGGIFFELVNIGEHKNEEGRIIPVIAFRLYRPNNDDYFRNIVPRPGIDSSLVNIITELRQLTLNVITGDVMNKKDLGPKTILINKDDKKGRLGENYTNGIRAKYKENIMEVDSEFVLDALMRRDPKYIYIKNASAFYCEDGTLIPLRSTP